VLGVLIRIYRLNPFRPHCGNGHHVALCRFIGLDESWCPAKDA
jgi:hypothetical protein